jgi:hypothetical protein
MLYHSKLIGFNITRVVKSWKHEPHFHVPKLTRLRIVAALAIAVGADGLQFLSGPLGWTFGDQIIDVVAMVLTSWVIGFHWLLLPTFAVEFIPLLDELPTWTACVAAVVALRRRAEKLQRIER